MHTLVQASVCLGFCVIMLFTAKAAGGTPALVLSADEAALNSIRSAPACVESDAPPEAVRSIAVETRWEGNVCKASVTNKGSAPVAIKEVLLARIPHQLPGETKLYGEGFTMLSQTGGTLAAPVDIGGYKDAVHYRIPQPQDATVVYGLLTLAPPTGGHLLLGFTSCRRFVGRFYIRDRSIDVVMDTEGLMLAPGESWALEEFMALAGKDRNALLAAFADRINVNHPRLPFDPVPTGWCSWYCFGPAVTATAVVNNLDAIAANRLPLKYIQIDDGYQAAMGDWLETGKAFEGGIKNVLKQIRDASFEPAIWVAPFVAEENSRVFKEHPDWFVRDANGQPLRSDTVTFGGWRCGPWYALDGTNPEAQRHLENVFRTLRQEWGCTYFKLDANFWGAIHGGRFYDPKATRVEAYRQGMAAVLRGAGDAFILGCNHPLWPSLGLIHGARSSNDINRSWDSFSHTTIETFNRNWQNGKLWWNDPDCILLTGKPSDDVFRFHATAICASGGMALSGDNLATTPPEKLDMLRKLLPPTGIAASFQDDTFRIGVIDQKDRRLVCLFNWEDKPQSFDIELPYPCQVHEVWTNKKLGKQKGRLAIKDMPGHSAQLLVLVPGQT